MKKNPIDEFLEGYNKKNTLLSYKQRLEHYFNALQTDPMTYFKEKRDYDSDIRKFLEYVEHRAPVSIKMDINTVKMFLDENGVNLSKVLSKKTKKLIKQKTKRARPITQDIVSSPEELKQILQYGTLKDRALFLFLSSSGVRIDEALQLTFDDIKLDKSPARIYISATITKTDESRFTFISDEAKDCLIEWKKHRPKYLHQACNKSIKEKWENDPKVFPYSYPTACRMWHRLLKQSGFIEMDKRTHRYRRHIHTLRKYFRIYLAPNATSDVAELLLGHQDTLGNVYRDKYPETKLADMYKRAMPDISVFEATPDLAEHTKEINKLKADNQRLKDEIAEIKAELLERRVEKLEITNGIKKERK